MVTRETDWTLTCFSSLTIYSATSGKSSVTPRISMSNSPSWLILVIHIFGGSTEEMFSNKTTQRFLLTWIDLSALILVVTTPFFCSKSLILESSGRSRSTSSWTRLNSLLKLPIVSATNACNISTATIATTAATVGQMTRRSVTQVKSFCFLRNSGGSRLMDIAKAFLTGSFLLDAIRTSSSRDPMQGHRC